MFHISPSLIGGIWSVLLGALAVVGASASAQNNAAWSSALANGSAQARQGQLTLALESLAAAQRAAETPFEQMRAAGELGATLMVARRYDEAEAPLRQAFAASTGAWHARYAADLGNLAALRKRKLDAERLYHAARALATHDPELKATIDLNLARLAADQDRLAALDSLLPELDKMPDSRAKGVLLLDFGLQARSLGAGGLPLAYRSLDRARRLLAPPPATRAYAQVLDALAQAYEDQGRIDDAIYLTREALALGRSLPPGAIADVTIDLEWRLGRLHRAANNGDLALAAYQRAVDQIEAVRQDIPIEYENGRSSFQATLGPILLGLIDLLLQRVDEKSGDRQQERLRRTLGIVELIKQTEMQDFLGDRCAVEATQGGKGQTLPAGTAVLYPILLPDRLELLLETDSGVTRRTVDASGATVQAATRAFADALRNDQADYRPLAQRLYGWLLAPFEDALADKPIDTLVFVPDGVLRLIPIDALHDGRQFVLERYATGTVIGMSMTNPNLARKRRIDSLVAGMSEAGPVVGKLDDAMVRQMMGTDPALPASTAPAESRSLRSPRGRLPRGDQFAPASPTQRLADLRQALALPGVQEEVTAVGTIVGGKVLLNARFTATDFRNEVGTGAYENVHIASHGVFGGSARTSFIMAYDDLLTLDDLQAILRSERFRNNPVELLTLSACETAEGDDRSPLGIAGAAIKARARSVLGTLWPVDDRAATTVMEAFYTGLRSGELSKAEALRQARLKVMRTEATARPVYWAPFILVGSWR